MTTIAERLRAGPNSGDPLFEEAADEIERLLRLCQDMANVQQQNEQTYEKAADDIERMREFNTKLCAEIERQEAEVKRYRGILTSLRVEWTD